jgi:leader peptidase (prepilin peptidase)/N-methyltransferase
MTLFHHAILALLFIIVGSCVGSFVNVCAYRLPRAMSLIRPSSRCPRCGAVIRKRDNVPVVGWFVLRGRCRHCRCAIPARYMVVELALGFLFAGVYLLAIALGPGDLWERAGAPAMLAVLLASWTSLAFGTARALVRHDAQKALSEPDAGASNPPAAGCVDPV